MIGFQDLSRGDLHVTLSCGLYAVEDFNQFLPVPAMTPFWGVSEIEVNSVKFGTLDEVPQSVPGVPEFLPVWFHFDRIINKETL